MSWAGCATCRRELGLNNVKRSVTGDLVPTPRDDFVPRAGNESESE